MKKTQKPGYLVIGSIIIGIVAILAIYFVLIATGLIQTSKNHITITTESAEKMYDGTVLVANTDEDWSIAHGKLLDGHVIEATIIGQQTVVGESDNIIAVTIYDSQGADVTGKYHIEYQLGKLSVKGKRLAFATQSAEKYYDGQPLTIADNAWEFLEGELLPGHTYTAHATGQITNIGTAEVQLLVTVLDETGFDVTSYYSIEIQAGTLKVEPRRIVVSADLSGTISSEGGQLSSSSVFVSGSLLEGHTAYYKPMQTNVSGTSIDTVFVYVLDENGNDVTSFYEITTPLGDLTIENPGTFFPEVPSDLINTDPYKELYEQMGGELPNIVGGLDINGDDVADLPIQPDGGFDLDGDGKSDITLDGEGMVDIDGDGKGDVPIQSDGSMDLDGDGESDAKYLPDGMYDIDGDGVGDVPVEMLGALALIECYVVNADRDGYVYLRQESYGDYDGNDWCSPTPYTGEIHPYLFSTESLKNADYLATTVRITPKLDGMKYALPYYYVNGDYPSAFMNDCYATDNSQKDVTYTATYIPYNFDVADALQIPASLSAEELAYRNYVYSTYLGVPEETRAALAALAAENGLDASDANIISLVAAYIQGSAKYNLNFAPFPEGVDNIIYFLTEGKEGVCRHYAAAATLMYRTLGIPARYTVGFATSVEAGQDVSVSAMQAHAWVEVYVDGFGWVQVEVTGGGEDLGFGDPIEQEEASGMNGNYVMHSAPDDVKNGGNHVADIRTRQEGPVYLRVRSYGKFDGNSWLKANGTDELMGISPFTVNLLGLNGASAGLNRTLSIFNIAETCPYMLPYFAEIDGVTSTDCEVFGEYLLEEGIDEIKISYTYYDYLTSGFVKLPNNSYVNELESLYVEQYMSQYLEIDDYTRSFLEGKLEEIGVSASDSAETKINAVARYLQYSAGLSYNMNCGDVPSEYNGIEYFLDVSKSGICRHFATTATLIYRTLGLPARYTVGYMVKSDGNNMVEIYGKNAHAWVEVYVESVGWIPVEVTAPAEIPKTDIYIPTGSDTEEYATGIELTNPNIYWNSLVGMTIDGKTVNSGWVYYPDESKFVNSETGHWFSTKSVTTTGKITDRVGEVTNGVRGLVIYDAAGNNVSSRYSLKPTGKLKITPIVVYVKTADATITDESEQKYCHEYTLVDKNGNKIELLDGHEIRIDFEYDEENPAPKGGIVPNDATTVRIVMIVDGEEVNVGKEYYQIIVEAGKIIYV